MGRGVSVLCICVVPVLLDMCDVPRSWPCADECVRVRALYAETCLEYMDRRLCANTPFLLSHNLTLADLVAATSLALLEAVGHSVARHTHVAAWLQRMRRLREWPEVHAGARRVMTECPVCLPERTCLSARASFCVCTNEVWAVHCARMHAQCMRRMSVICQLATARTKRSLLRCGMRSLRPVGRRAECAGCHCQGTAARQRAAAVTDARCRRRHALSACSGSDWRSTHRDLVRPTAGPRLARRWRALTYGRATHIYVHVHARIHLHTYSSSPVRMFVHSTLTHTDRRLCAKMSTCSRPVA